MLFNMTISSLYLTKLILTLKGNNLVLVLRLDP